MPAPRVLIIDDERNFRRFLAEALESEGYEVAHAATARAGVMAVRDWAPQIVLLDQNLPDRSGLDLLPELRNTLTKPVVIVITAYAKYSYAVEAVKGGAYHYLAKPFELPELLDVLTTAAARQEDADVADGKLAHIVGHDPAIIALKEQVARIASSRLPIVLLQGESGTGKELIARAIHRLSDRSSGPLVCVNCAALTESLLLSELFGHERGAFTDARQAKKGLFEVADHGTLFLDEITEMSLHAQAALLRVLEQRTVRRVGSTAEIVVDARVIAATNRNLADAVRDGLMRGDLYYRLNIVQLNIPPLRHRRDDIIELAEYFANQLAADYSEPPRTFSAGAAAVLTSYDWPGNVRELRNAVERAYVVGNGAVITPADLSREITSDAKLPPASQPDVIDFQDAKRQVNDQFERSYLESVLTQAAGNVTRAAETAGMVRQVFQRLMKKHGLKAEQFRRAQSS